jgi:hypothetical protein
MTGVFVAPGDGGLPSTTVRRGDGDLFEADASPIGDMR